MYRTIPATAVALSLCFSAHAQEQTEVEELRDRVEELEQRLDAQGADKQSSTAASDDAAAASANNSGATLTPNSNAFNPAISLIIDAKYRHLELDPDTYEIGGFVPAGGHGHGDEDGHSHGAGPGDRGFSLDETELSISGNIDPYWAGNFTAGVSDGEIDIEEAWIQNSGYIPGVIAKAGRFFSGIGYINEQHPHAWDFADAPLVQQAFYGTGNLGDDGLQLRYVAPTPLFLEFGLEAGRGENFPGSETNGNGPNATAGFVHLGGDVGFSNSYRIGASYRQTTADEREFDGEDTNGTEVENIFSDLDSKTWGIDFVWKWAPNGDPSTRNFKFQAEYFNREEDGQLNYDAEGDGAGPLEGAYSSEQDGWYAQVVYQFMPRWRVGARYDLLDSGDIKYDPITAGTITRDDLLSEHKPEKTTVMIDFSSSEFARFRLQYAQDKARYDETDDQIVFQYIVSLGAHGAHRF